MMDMHRSTGRLGLLSSLNFYIDVCFSNNRTVQSKFKKYKVAFTRCQIYI